MALGPCGWWLRRVQILVLMNGLASSQVTNRTIDDEGGDSVTGIVPSYSPAGHWVQGAECSVCSIRLSRFRTFNGTWHDSTRNPNDAESHYITANFTGTAVYVYNIIANQVPFDTNLRFTLDGSVVGQYSHDSEGSTDFQYNTLVFERTGLPNTNHTIAIEAIRGDHPSAILFDRIIYTFEEVSEAPQPVLSTDVPPSYSFSSDAPPTERETSATANSRSIHPTTSKIPPESSPSVSTPPVPSRGTETIPSFSMPSCTPSEPNSTSPTLKASSASPSTRSTSEIPTGSPSNVAVYVPPLSVHPSVSPATLAWEITYTDGTGAASVAASGAIARVGPDTIVSAIAHSYNRSPSVSTPPEHLSHLAVRAVAVPLDSDANRARTLPPVYPSSLSWRHTFLNPDWTNSSLSLSRSSDGDAEPHTSFLSSVTDEKLVSGGLNPSGMLGNHDVGPPLMPWQTAATPTVRSSESEDAPPRTSGRLTLRAQVAALQQEVERLREQQELQHLQLESDVPPRYDEAS
ncbi:hypothetical protein C8Q78DRAFT_989965 [Trametes maxima]|nr:hypothetical protein C8Q78DRAFT_989965 [Trametes maxima]